MKPISILSRGTKKQQKKPGQSKPSSSSQQFKYSYSIIPTNFVNLSEENQAQKLGQFNDILRVIEDRIKITMSRRLISITVEGQITEMPVMQVHLESHQPLGRMFSELDFLVCLNHHHLSSQLFQKLHPKHHITNTKNLLFFWMIQIPFVNYFLIRINNVLFFDKVHFTFIIFLFIDNLS